MNDELSHYVMPLFRRMGDERSFAGTAFCVDDYLITAKHFDVSATFNKPVDLQALRAKVEEIIQKH